MRLIGKTRESSTLQLLLPPYALVCWKYFAGTTMTATEFAGAIGILLAIWLGREWKSAHFKTGHFKAGHFKTGGSANVE